MWCQVTRKCGNYDHGLEELVLKTFQRRRTSLDLSSISALFQHLSQRPIQHPTSDSARLNYRLIVIDDQVALIREAFAPSWQVFQSVCAVPRLSPSIPAHLDALSKLH